MGFFIVDMTILEPYPSWFLNKISEYRFERLFENEMFHKGIVEMTGSLKATISLSEFLQLSLRASSKSSFDLFILRIHEASECLYEILDNILLRLCGC